jgi:uncharacterized protein
MEKVVKRISSGIRYLLSGPSGLRPALGIVLFVAVTILISYLLISILPYRQSHGHYLSLTTHISNDGALLAAVLSGTVVMAMMERCSVWSYGLGDRRFWRHFLGGTSIGLLLASLVIVCLVAVGRLAIDGLLLHDQDIVIYGVAWLATFVVVALAEESLFRGYLQTTLARLIGFWPAAVLLSFAFGLVHLGNTGEEDLLGIADVVIFGLLLSLCLRLSGSLWWGIGFHAAWDFAGAFLYGQPIAGHVLQERLLEYHTVGNPFWTGSPSGGDDSLFALPMLGVAAAIVALTFREPAADLLSRVRGESR